MNRSAKHPTHPGDAATRAGRLAKAREFLRASEILRELDTTESVFNRSALFTNSFVALRILSGIASSDAICIRELAAYPHGDDHSRSVAVLETAAGRPVAKHLRTLLVIKTRIEYSMRPATDEDIHNAGVAADALLTEAER